MSKLTEAEDLIEQLPASHYEIARIAKANLATGRLDLLLHYAAGVRDGLRVSGADLELRAIYQKIIFTLA